MEETKLQFEGAKVIVFCDETKFSINNGDVEDAIFYFGIAANTGQIAYLDAGLKEIFKRFRLQAPTFHAAGAFKETRPRTNLMGALVNFIVKNRLKCFCFKYQKDRLFQISTGLSYLNDDIINFNNSEFQALFYFLIHLNTHLQDTSQDASGGNVVMYFDRNVYGKVDVEAFKFPSDLFVIKRMTFSEKSLISLLALPDFFGYIFRKSKESHNKGEDRSKPIGNSPLAISSYSSLLKLTQENLFHFLDVDHNALNRIVKGDL